jgi:NMT1-like family
VILEQYEVPFDKVQVIHLPTTEVVNAIRAERPDAILTIGPLGSRITTDAIAALVAITPNRKSPTFLPIGSSEAIAERFPAYESSEIDKGAFGGSPSRPAEELETVMVSHFLVAASTVSDTTIGELAKLLLSSRQTLSSELSGFAKIEKPDTDKDANVAVHPGAKAYFDDEQKTFFERYSDHLFWLFMVVPLLGSGAAGIASYMKAGERTHHVRLLNKILDVSKRARSIDSMPALDKLQAEVDDLVIQTVHRAERSALGESPQLSFVLAIEQARFAIADRRAILIGRRR